MAKSTGRAWDDGANDTERKVEVPEVTASAKKAQHVGLHSCTCMIFGPTLHQVQYGRRPWSQPGQRAFHSKQCLNIALAVKPAHFYMFQEHVGLTSTLLLVDGQQIPASVKDRLCKGP